MHLKGHCRFLKLNHCESKVTVTKIGRNCFPRAFVLEIPLPDTVWARNLQCSTRYCPFQKLGQPCSFLASWSVFYSVVYCQADLNCFFSSMMGIYRQIAVGCRDFLLFFCFEFFFLRSNTLPSLLVRVQDGAGMRLCSSGKKNHNVFGSPNGTCTPCLPCAMGQYFVSYFVGVLHLFQVLTDYGFVALSGSEVSSTACNSI